MAASALLAATWVASATAQSTIWDGVFTLEQAQRGRTAYTGPCDRCHGYKLDGASDDPDMLPAPPVAGRKFLRAWSGRSLAALVEYTHRTMPANNPGFLAAQELVDVVAYMLLVSGAPAGDTELSAESPRLARIVIERRRDDGSSARRAVSEFAQ